MIVILIISTIIFFILIIFASMIVFLIISANIIVIPIISARVIIQKISTIMIVILISCCPSGIHHSDHYHDRVPDRPRPQEARQNWADDQGSKELKYGKLRYTHT
jgi:hypothetical protein